MMNLNSLHDESSDEPRPLSVAIVGAGIGGLTAAISLRQAGHNVQVCQSCEN